MVFMSTSVIGTDTVHDLRRTEQPVRCDDGPFAMHPFGLARGHPGAFTRQPAGQDADPLPSLLDVVIVLSQPGTPLVAAVPRRLVPAQQHCGEPVRRQARAAPGQKRRRRPADRTALPKPPPHLFGLVGDVAPQQAIAGQRCRLGGSFGACFFSPAPALRVRRPGRHRGLRQATPPDCIPKAEAPRRLRPGKGHPPGAAFFFRLYAGSGLVIECLARCQRTPRRASARRMASPLMGRCVRPSADAIVAASTNVH